MKGKNQSDERRPVRIGSEPGGPPTAAPTPVGMEPQRHLAILVRQALSDNATSMPSSFMVQESGDSVTK